MRRGIAVMLVWLLSHGAGAQERLTQNDFEIDAVTTPVLASSRITGLSGAYTALAEGIGGVPYNPASYAARALWEHEWLEWDITGGLLFPGAFSKVDFFNNGLGSGLGVDSFLFGSLGFRLQFGDLGLGLLLEFQNYNAGPNNESTIGFVNVHYGLGYALLEGQLVIGVGAHTTNMTISTAGETLVEFTGTGAELGGLLRLADLPFRVGVAVRSPVSSTVVADEAGPPTQVGGFVLPRAVHLPWEIQAGFAFQFGDRPFNVRNARVKRVAEDQNASYERERCLREREQVLRELSARGEPAPPLVCPNLAVRARDREWRIAERERRGEARRAADELESRVEDDLYDLMGEVYSSMPRRYVLLTVDLLVQGPTEDGVGVDAFLAQERRRRGRGWEFGFRVGVEGEPWDDRLKLRAGSYLEPGRYASVNPRLHGTVGFDFRLFTLLGIDWRAGFTFDGARDYVNWGVSIGIWH